MGDPLQLIHLPTSGEGCDPVVRPRLTQRAAPNGAVLTYEVAYVIFPPRPSIQRFANKLRVIV